MRKLRGAIPHHSAIYVVDSHANVCKHNAMKIEVRESPIHGRGVFATKKIKKGEIIEVCPVVVVDKKQVPFLEKTELGNYYFDWEKGKAAIALGFGSIYNHSYNPNAKYMPYDEKTLRFRARRTIRPGEEICTNYNGEPTCKTKVWFDR